MRKDLQMARRPEREPTLGQWLVRAILYGIAAWVSLSCLMVLLGGG